MGDRPVRRAPDGRLETRTPDEMLRDAVENIDIKALPGAGKPLNLDTYFKGGAENRAAYQLLKDNQILPLHLQYSKDAEHHSEAARDLLARESATLEKLLEEIRIEAARFAQAFPDLPTVLECLELEAWPDAFPAPAPGQTPGLHDMLQTADRLAGKINLYNLRVQNLVRRYVEHLALARQNIEQHDRYTPDGVGRPGASSSLKQPDLAAAETDVRSAFPELPFLPENLARRVRASYRLLRPPFWKRHFSGVRSSR